MRTTTAALVLALLTPATTLAEAYAYRSIGAQGEVMFSDIPSSSATSIELPSATSDAPSSAEQVQLMLMVADELAQARIAREAEREAKRERAAQARREREDTDQNSSGLDYPHYGYPRYAYPSHTYPSHTYSRKGFPARGGKHGGQDRTWRQHEAHRGHRPAPPRDRKSVPFKLPQ